MEHKRIFQIFTRFFPFLGPYFGYVYLYLNRKRFKNYRIESFLYNILIPFAYLIFLVAVLTFPILLTFGWGWEWTVIILVIAYALIHVFFSKYLNKLTKQK